MRRKCLMTNAMKRTLDEKSGRRRKMFLLIYYIKVSGRYDPTKRCAGDGKDVLEDLFRQAQ